MSDLRLAARAAGIVRAALPCAHRCRKTPHRSGTLTERASHWLEMEPAPSACATGHRAGPLGVEAYSNS